MGDSSSTLLRDSGIDIIVELSEREINRQVEQTMHDVNIISVPLEDDDPLGLGKIAGNVYLKLSRPEVHLDYPQDYRHGDSPGIDRVTLEIEILSDIAGSHISFSSFYLRGYPICFLRGVKLHLSAIIFIEGRLEVIDHAPKAGESTPVNKKEIIMNTKSVENDDKPKVQVSWTDHGRVYFETGLNSLIPQDIRDEIAETVRLKLEEGIADYIKNDMPNPSLTPEGIILDESSTDPFVPHDIEVRTIRSRRNPHIKSLAFLIQTTGSSLNQIKKDITLEPAVSLDDAIPRISVAVTLSNWLLLRHIIRPTFIESIKGLAEGDFDTDAACKLVKNVKVTEDGFFFYLTKLEAIIQDDHIRITGGIIKETGEYIATSDFLVRLKFTVAPKVQMIGIGWDFSSWPPKPIFQTDPDTRILQIEKIEEKIWSHFEYQESWLDTLSQDRSNFLRRTQFFVSTIITKLVIDVKVRDALRRIPSEFPLPLLAEGILIDKVAIDDTTFGGSLILGPPYDRPEPNLIMTNGNKKESNSFLIPPQEEGPDVGIFCYFENRGDVPLQITGIRFTVDSPFSSTMLSLPPPTIIGIPSTNWTTRTEEKGPPHDNNPFFVEEPLPVTIDPKSQRFVTLRFSPNKVGITVGRVEISSTDPVRPSFEVPFIVSVSRRPRGQLLIAPKEIQFNGIIHQWYNSKIEVTNVGDRDAIIGAKIENETIQGQFFVSYVGLSPLLKPGQSRSIRIQYKGTQTGISRAILAIEMWSKSFVEKYSVNLFANAGRPKLVLDPPKLDFGSVPKKQSRTLLHRIRNEGDYTLVVEGIYHISRGGVFYSFSIDPSLAFPIIIPPSSFVDYQVSFGPSYPGEESLDEWEIVSNDPVHPRIRFYMVGLSEGPRLDVLPDIINFGIFDSSTIAREKAIIQNKGSTDLLVDGIKLESGREYSLVNADVLTSLTIPPKGELVVLIEFKVPGQVGDYRDYLVIKSNDVLRPIERVSIYGRRI